MLLAVVWQVFSRYIFNIPSTLTDELASFSLIWLGLFGSAYATGKKLHLSIDLIPDKILAKSPLFFNGIINLLICFFAFSIMAIGGSRLCWLTYVLDQKSAALQVPLYLVYSSVPINGFIIMYYTLDTILSSTKLKKKQDDFN
ncbi:TRAP transporter small permease [Aquimarina celericrescens]|uniref:TRAP transporter small permease n=1 Tax=Aquimarina celericrescens TaxID=1964542 RepID=A0ABW5B0A9_9FLAO|nr:TRAP transporter small permease [Aquimarina celericrescens]